MRFYLGALLVVLAASPSFAATVTFEDLSLGPESAENGSGLTPYETGTVFGETENRNRLTSGGVVFENRYIPAFFSWSRWAYSNRTDTMTVGFTNDLSAFAGGGAGGSANFAVSFLQTNSIALGAGQHTPVSVMVTNVTYPALSMRDGDGFAKKFGGDSGDDPDFFLLEIVGLDGVGQETGIVPFHLADFRFSDNGMDYIVDTWEPVDLSPLGSNVSTLEFRLSSSDNGMFGMNTPAYFAIDDLVLVPEPSAALLLLIAMGCFLARRRMLVVGLAVVGIQGDLVAGPFPPAAGEPESDAVRFDDERIEGWATSVTDLARGPVDIAAPNGAVTTYGTEDDVIGPATEDVYDVLSLGDGGSITVAFAGPVFDRPGPDLAVFENGFDNTFLELAFVEVSANGVDFVRFPARSETQTDTQIGTHGRLDPTDISNLAGKYRAGFGVPFDLSETGLGMVTHVRIVDVVGSIDSGLGTMDSEFRAVNDPYPTNFPTGGFDLDGVAVLGPAETSYAIWSQQLPADKRGMMDDHDGDREKNIHEYAFEERASDAIRALGEAQFAFRRTPWKTDLEYVLETSTDMRTWQPVARSAGGGATQSLAQGVTVEESTVDGVIGVVVSEVDSVRSYARVRVTVNNS